MIFWGVWDDLGRLGKGGMYIRCLIMYVAGVMPFVSTAAQMHLVFEVSSRRDEALSKLVSLKPHHTPYHIPVQESHCDISRIRRSNPRNLDLD